MAPALVSKTQLHFLNQSFILSGIQRLGFNDPFFSLRSDFTNLSDTYNIVIIFSVRNVLYSCSSQAETFVLLLSYYNHSFCAKHSHSYLSLDLLFLQDPVGTRHGPPRPAFTTPNRTKKPPLIFPPDPKM